ncbi:S-layer homology domain-containing protein [Sporosarcina sp. resist]|uniref:S-layer homology domain-containing protein n=1 Tax=Sporosarcina sp. resist TaxID=2762563 RepID=UPI00164ECCB1|nr:S-layer homology domain-containing protein [Sporosarcina sp. resist]QNK87608.1 S-layer homology domain-containing protein [Sporosarcina sp. resist]
MANQPSKYSKFLVGAASAALVASAVAPVASAADFKDTKGNTHEEAINALSDSGVIKGYSDGTFLPNKTLTRSDVVKMMGKWLVTEGHAIPADARTNPRFTDLSTKSNAELLDYAAVVKDAGVFIGSNGKLLAVDNITRENMALVLVRAFDTVEKIDLATYVAGQDFKRDVKDLTSAKSEARAAIDVLDFFDITNPTVASFNPKGNTTRGHFATFLHKTINADFSKVAGEAAEGVVSVKAVNATTVEVAFKEDAKDVNASDYTIEGLAISNAAVKQTDSKVVVLTTAVQTGDKEYTLKSGASTLGKFKGISGVIPTKITINTASVQGVVGKEVTLKADIGVKEAGVPVTFNVSAGSKLNKDHIEEVTTDANGVATYSYTQYVSGEQDDVVAYPTGAPSVRSLATVYWGVDAILAVTAQDDKQGNNVANGANKVYKVTYKNPKTGTPVANQKMHVTFVENVGVNIDKMSKATVNGTNPMQLANGTTPVTAEVVTDSKGEATFTVSGHNTTVTPVVFLNQVVNNVDVKTFEATKLQAQVAEKVVFGATQSDYVIDVTRDGGEEAAVNVDNGREYKVVLKTKDGKVAANEIINLAFNEDLDRNFNTNTEAYFVDEDGIKVPDARTKSYTVKTDAKGEATFTIGSDTVKDYATPIAWIDINTSNAKEGKFDDGEPFKVSSISYFAESKLTEGTVKAYNNAVSTTKTIKEITGLETATFKFTAANQSGKAMNLPSGYNNIEATFTVFNDGANDIIVNGTNVVSPNRSYTTSKTTEAVPTITVSSENKSSKVRVVANGTAVPAANTNNRPINLGSHTAEVKITSTVDVGDFYTGLVTGINTTDQKIQFAGKDFVSYKGATFTAANGNALTQVAFEKHIQDEFAAGFVSQVTLKKDGDKITVSIIKDGVTAPPVVQNQTDVTAAVSSVVIPATAQQGTTITLPTTHANGTAIAWASNSALLPVSTGVVGTITADENAVLTATFTKGTGADAVTVTKKYTVKLTPVVVADVTKGQLLVKANDADALIVADEHTATTTSKLQDAVNEARALLAGSATTAEINKAAKDLDSATAALKSAVTANAAGLVFTFTPVVAAANVDLTALNATATVAIALTPAETSAAVTIVGNTATIATPVATPATGDTITLAGTVNGVATTLVLTYNGVSSAWELAAPVVIK